MTDDLDYIKAEAERLPNGTAAKALRMMQPTVQWNPILDDIGNTTITEGGES